MEVQNGWQTKYFKDYVTFRTILQEPPKGKCWNMYVTQSPVHEMWSTKPDVNYTPPPYLSGGAPIWSRSSITSCCCVSCCVMETMLSLRPDAGEGGCSNLKQVINDILLWIYQHISWWTSWSRKLWSIQLFGCDHCIHTVAIETCTTTGYPNKCVHCESLHSRSWITWDCPLRL